MKRVFMKAGAKPINDRVHRIEFEFDEDSGAVERYTVTLSGRTEHGAKWNFKDAMSLVESGHWAEVVFGQSGNWIAPGPAELAEIAKKRTTLPDQPATTVELVW